MFKKTKQVLHEMWEDAHIFRDPAPTPWEIGKGYLNLAKAMYKDIKEIFEPGQDCSTNNY